MTRLVFAGVCAAFLSAATRAPSAPAPEADKGVKAVVARAIEARGGAAYLNKYRAVTVKVSATFHDVGLEANGTLVTRELSAQKSRSDLSIRLGSEDMTIKEVFDGEKGWTATNGTVTPMTKEELAEAREQLYFNSITDLRGLTAPDVTLTPLGESKVGDKPAVGILVTAKGHRDVRLYFSKESGLLLKSEFRGKTPGDRKEATETFLYDDYKNVSGLAFPFHTTLTRDGKPSADFHCTEVTLAESFPPGTFAKP